jgi:glycosyltransferase involved in cell wall biosynthesis
LNRKAMQEAYFGAEASAQDETGLVAPLQRMQSQGWRIFYQPGVRVSVPLSAAREHTAASWEAAHNRRRVLVVDAVMLTPDQDSGSLRMFCLLEAFLDLGWHVSFVASNLEFRGHYGRQLQQRGVEVFSYPQVQSIPNLLEQRGRAFDVVVLSRPDVAESFMEGVRRHAPAASIWYDTVDLHFLSEQREAELHNDPAGQTRADDRKIQEIGLIRKADCTLVVSSVERDLLSTEVPGARVEILSNIHDLRPTDTPFAERDAIVFIGGFNHPPNVDAMMYYVAEILPLVSAQLGIIPTYIIGSQAPAEILALGDPDRGVFVTGFVPDVTPYFSRARLSVAPLRYGAGVKGKVNMSMAYGVPVVASPCAAEGMFLEPERDILIGEDAPAFADQVIRLYRDRLLWEKLSRNGQLNVETHFSRGAARTAIEALLADFVK